MKHFALVGNKPVNGIEGDYLSDHYGIAVELDVAPSSHDGDEKIRAAAKSSDRNETFNRRLKDDFLKNINCGSNPSAKSSEKRSVNTGRGKADREQDYRWGTVGTKDTPRRVNGKRARSEMTVATLKRVMSNPSNILQSANKETEPVRGVRGSKKERTQLPPAANKRGRFDSSSSDDDEEMFRALAQKQGREYQPPSKRKMLQHRRLYSSSDED